MPDLLGGDITGAQGSGVGGGRHGSSKGRLLAVVHAVGLGLLGKAVVDGVGGQAAVLKAQAAGVDVASTTSSSAGVTSCRSTAARASALLHQQVVAGRAIISPVLDTLPRAMVRAPLFLQARASNQVDSASPRPAAKAAWGRWR